KEKNPHLPVIMVTKSEEENLMNQAIGEKIDDYLTKPVNPSQVLSATKRILEKRKIRKEHLSRKYVEDFNHIRTTLSEPLSWKEWIDIHRVLSEWDLEMEEFKDLGLIETQLTQKRECDLEFGRYVGKNYLNWIDKEDAPPLSVDVVAKYLYPLLLEKKPVFFIVVDCMRLDQYLLIEPVLNEYFSLKREYYYSILPTATPYSRNALFSGLFPGEISQLYPDLWKAGTLDDYSRNRYERQLLDILLKKLKLSFKTEPKYVKVLDAAEGDNLARKISSYKNSSLLSIVFNFLDILAHGRSESEILKEIAPDEGAFRSLMRSWFLHSSLFEILKYLSRQDCSILLTTDHGSVLGTRGSVAHGKKDTSTNLRYKYGDNLNCEQREAILIKDPKKYKLPTYTMSTTYIIAKEDYYFVYPSKQSEYERQYRNSFQHGGISLEEMILPIVTLRPK
ncbi:MAG: PglZ domain-containing protein, partial [candidate division Zixibacteria bacterium]|nr:PglZ domain-containing protein [candidate division Zixibacteria bacterium]